MAYSSKEVRGLIKLLRAQGFVVEPRKGKPGHHSVHTAEGVFVTDLAGSPSEHRGWDNALSALRRHGYFDRRRPHKKKTKD